MRENLELKAQLTNEYLRTGGLEKIDDVHLLDDIINFRQDAITGKVNADTVTPRLNSFMLAILGIHTMPPILHQENISEYLSFLQKKIFFDQIKIDKEEQIDELLKKYNTSDNILFRGQREAKWRLYSSLQRFWVWDKFEKDQNSYIEFLKIITKKGKDDYSEDIRKILSEFHIDSLNDLAVLGFLQHHNCPSPLLDWTYNFENALFFGIDGLQNPESVVEIDNYFSIYFTDESNFGKGGMNRIISESIVNIGQQMLLNTISEIADSPEMEKEMIEKFGDRDFFDKDKLTGSGLITKLTEIDSLSNIAVTYFSDKDITNGIAFSLSNSGNIRKQNGVFTWNNSFDKPLEVVGLEQYIEENGKKNIDDYRFCECYNINKKLEPYIREKLEKRGINSSTIYPDKDFDSKYIYEVSKK